MADELANFLDLARPWAEAVVALAAVHDQHEDLASEVRRLEGQISKHRATVLSLKAEGEKHTAAAQDAQAKAIEAKSQAAAMLADARTQASAIVAASQTDAAAAARVETYKHTSKLTALTEQIAEAQATLADLGRQIEARRADHAAVLDSIASLRGRLGAV